VYSPRFEVEGPEGGAGRDHRVCGSQTEAKPLAFQVLSSWGPRSRLCPKAEGRDRISDRVLPASRLPIRANEE